MSGLAATGVPGGATAMGCIVDTMAIPHAITCAALRHAVQVLRRAIWLIAALHASTAAAGFWDPGFRNGALRTEYAPGTGVGSGSLTLNFAVLPTDHGCLWNVHDPLASFFRCPGRRDVDPAVWSGNLQARSACGGDETPVGDSWRGCLSYRQDTFFALNSPAANFWVVHANNDPAFDQCRSGPPAVSEIIVDPVTEPTRPNLYKVAFDTRPDGTRALNLVVAPWEHDFTCAGYLNLSTGGDKQMTIAYLSVGAHGNRGNGEAVGHAHRSDPAQGDVLQFDATLRGRAAIACRADRDDPCRPDRAAAHAGVLIVTQWSGIRRMLFVDLYAEGALSNAKPSVSHWSWPIQESMFWPGGEVAVVSAGDIEAQCPGASPVPTLEVRASPATRYALDLSSLLVCAERLALWSAPVPDERVEIEAVDWFVEIGATTGMLWLMIESPVIGAR